MIFFISNIFLFLGSLIFINQRLLQHLRYYQQEEYNSKRFLNWLKTNKAFDKKGSLVTLIFIIIYFLVNCSCYNMLISLCLMFSYSFLAKSEEDPRTSGKIKLKMTARANRIFYLALMLVIFSLTLFIFIYNLKYFTQLISLLIIFQILPLFLILSTYLLIPDEKRRQNAFISEAKSKLKQIDPFTIGITGSYGKTSTKSILQQLLETSLGPTFAPPKSINTEMGITREIRENLKDYHKFAVIEMGAYNIGSIKRLCNLTPPQAAIITAVGLAHLERFKSEGNVLLAKSELAQAVPENGILICNADSPGAKEIAKRYPKKTTKLYAIENHSPEVEYTASDIIFSHQGSSFKIKVNNKFFNVHCKLYGKPNISNILAAFALAHTLGAKEELLVAAISNLEPFDNRLDVKKLGTYTQINDAYNSNPQGFKAALEVLAQLDGNKKILMTPGMIEFGEKQEELNRELARIAGKICSEVIIVGETNRIALTQGLNDVYFDAAKIYYVTNRQEAFTKLNSLIEVNDIVLIENDLPDLYEPQINF